MNQVRQCTTGNTQGLLTIPKQLPDVNKEVARISQPHETIVADGSGIGKIIYCKNVCAHTRTIQFDFPLCCSMVFFTFKPLNDSKTQ